jgi:hypothetical protein
MELQHSALSIRFDEKIQPKLHRRLWSNLRSKPYSGGLERGDFTNNADLLHSV